MVLRERRLSSRRCRIRVQTAHVRPRISLPIRHIPAARHNGPGLRRPAGVHRADCCFASARHHSRSVSSTRAVQLHVVGRVLDSTDKPVPGARITQWDTANTTMTDAIGTFEMTARVTPQDRWFWVTVEKPGFETSELARDVDTAANTSLRLHQIRTIVQRVNRFKVWSAQTIRLADTTGATSAAASASAHRVRNVDAELSSDRAELGVATCGPGRISAASRATNFSAGQGWVGSDNRRQHRGYRWPRHSGA